MADVENIIRFKSEGDQAVLSTYDALIAKATEAEKATESVFTGVAGEAKKAAAGTSQVVDALTTQAAKARETEATNKKAALSFASIRDAAKGMGQSVKDAVGNISVFGVSINDAREKLAATRKSLGDYAASSRAAGTAASAAGKSSAVGFNLARVGALALRTALGPIGLILTAVAVAFAAFAAVAKRSEPIMDAVAVASAAVGAAIDVIVDRAVSMAEAIFFANKALIQFFSGNISGAMESFEKATTAATAATASLSEELSREVRLAAQLKEQLIELERAELLLNAQRSLTAGRLKELNFIAEDTKRTTEERLAASQEAFAIEDALAQKELENAKAKLANELAELETGEKTLDLLKRLEQGTISYIEVRDQLGQGLSDQEDVERVLGLVQKVGDLEAANFERQTTQNNKTNVILEQQRQKRLKAIEERRKAEEDLANFRQQIEQQITQLAIDESEGEARIELERRVALEQLKIAEETAREKFKAAKQTFDLEAEFAELRAGVERDAARRTSEFRLAEAQKAIAVQRDIELARLELEVTTGNELLTREELLQQERTKIIRAALEEQRAIAVQEFGEDSAEVLKIDVELRTTEDADEKLTADFIARVRDTALKGVETRQQIRLAENELIQDSEDENLTAAQFREKRKTQILIDGLLERRKILLEQFGDNAPEIQLVDLEIDKLQQQIDALDGITLSPLDKIRNRIKDAFNLDDEALALITEQAKGAFDNIVSGLEAIYERQLIEQDKLIEQIDGRVETLQEALDRELELQEQGFANNAELRQRDLDEELARKEQAENKRLEIEKKAAKQQLLIDAAQQASSLALATANLLANEALKGLPGILLAGTIGFATIFATIQKARATAASFKPPEFRGGGFAEGVLVGPSHEAGGILGAYMTPQGPRVLSMEGDEHIMPVKETKQYAPALEAMRTGAIRGMADEDILRMLGRNPTLGLNYRASYGPKPDKTAEEFKKVGKEIVGAIMGQMQIVPDGKGGYKFVHPTGAVRPYGGKI